MPDALGPARDWVSITSNNNNNNIINIIGWPVDT